MLIGDLGIWEVSVLGELETIEKKDIAWKAMCLPNGTSFVVIPILHNF